MAERSRFQLVLSHLHHRTVMLPRHILREAMVWSKSADRYAQLGQRVGGWLDGRFGYDWILATCIGLSACRCFWSRDGAHALNHAMFLVVRHASSGGLELDDNLPKSAGTPCLLFCPSPPAGPPSQPGC
jgi:hypothetical protein